MNRTVGFAARGAIICVHSLSAITFLFYLARVIKERYGL